MRVVAACLLASLLCTAARAVPSFEAIKAASGSSDALLVDRNGEPLQELRTDRSKRRLEWTPLASISPAMKQALIAAEDQRFEHHGGVDWIGLARALKGNLFRSRTSGASTLTMQLAAFLDPALKPRHGRRNLWQKLVQLVEAVRLERRWTKDEILEAYLNLASFRGELQGISAASRGLWNKEPQGLDAVESLVLVALLPNPNAKAPTLARRACELARHLGQAIACDTLQSRVARVLSHPYSVAPRVALAPHVARLLVGKRKSLRVATTLDRKTQRFVMEALERQVIATRDRNLHDAAAIVVDNAAGEVLAYVGNVGSLATSAVDGARAKRQAGSTLKPFLYALAIDERLLTSSSPIADVPTEIAVGPGLYRPTNYDHIFHGTVPARVALGSSMNIPAVKTLELVGIDAFLDRLIRLGFEGLKPAEFYGPSMALGTPDVSLWDLTNAYRTLANAGRWSPLHLEPNLIGPMPQARVYSEGAAFIVSDILSDPENRSVGFGLESPLETRSWTAVKTGTSKDMRDNWCVGYSDRFTVGVWVGNFDGDPMWNVSGITGAAPAWVEIMNWLHESRPSHVRPAPPGVKRVQLVGGRREWFLAGTEPREHELLPRVASHRIRAPIGGTIVALDPDIPRDRQKVYFEISSPSRELAWELNGKRLGSAKGSFAWVPSRAGQYHLSLVDKRGRVVDEVTFSVRGTLDVSLDNEPDSF